MDTSKVKLGELDYLRLRDITKGNNISDYLYDTLWFDHIIYFFTVDYVVEKTIKNKVSSIYDKRKKSRKF